MPLSRSFSRSFRGQDEEKKLETAVNGWCNFVPFCPEIGVNSAISAALRGGWHPPVLSSLPGVGFRHHRRDDGRCGHRGSPAWGARLLTDHGRLEDVCGARSAAQRSISGLARLPLAFAIEVIMDDQKPTRTPTAGRMSHGLRLRNALVASPEKSARLTQCSRICGTIWTRRLT